MRRFMPVLVGLLFSFSVTVSGQEHHEDVIAPPQEETLKLLTAVQHLVENYYVEDIDQQALVNGALKGMLEVLDPHSTYLAPHTLELLRDNNRGHYYGYGLEVAVADGKIRVISPLANSSAAVAGVQAGDVLVKVDELQVDANDLDPMIVYIKKASLDDRTLRLTLDRDSVTDPVVLYVAPSEVDVITSVYDKLSDDVGYVKIFNFNQRTANEVRRAVEHLKATGIQGLVLDLRNNPGGLLEAAIEVADLFISDGTIVTTHGRFVHANDRYLARPGNTLLAHIPLVVLINKGSASAAEILAGALKDQERAKLVGERSFGKGTVQSLIPLLQNGGAVKLTTAKYATPNGQFIDEIGIKPDFNVNAESNEAIIGRTKLQSNWSDDQQLYAAFSLLQQPEQMAMH